MYSLYVFVVTDFAWKDKHEIYYQYGEDAINGGFPYGVGGHDPFDIFQNFFGGGDGSMGKRFQVGKFGLVEFNRCSIHAISVKGQKVPQEKRVLEAKEGNFSSNLNLGKLSSLINSRQSVTKGCRCTRDQS
ncbi:hypothetical protein IFM89_014615 [Coptis chinensis]|uniref:Uncharacterized protein n=1 Tax=Coptis chinensis TaxID=261450 RepID=A0A835IKR8_9MAGN|nr:hypothetical protein IFM89_014615 [Coptis chinensis]